MMTNLVFTVGGQSFEIVWYWLGLALAAPVLLAVLLAGFVLIRERQAGIVVKRFARKSLPPGRFIALDGEAGLQADTLAPGLHFGYWPWQYRVIKVPITVVPQGELALVLAEIGRASCRERV